MRSPSLISSLRMTARTTGLTILVCLAACQTGGSDATPEPVVNGSNVDADPMPAQGDARVQPWKLTMGDSIDGDHAVTVGEGHGDTAKRAEELARAHAQRSIASIRYTEVESLTTSSTNTTAANDIERETSKFQQNISLASAMTIRGGVWGLPETREISAGSFQCRIKFKVPNRLVRPAAHLRRYKGTDRVRECTSLLDQASSFETPDHFIAELCLKMLLSEQPSLSHVQRLASLCLEQGDPERAVRILRDYQSLVEDSSGSIERRINEINSMPLDVPLLLARLDLVSCNGVTLSAFHPRVTRSTKQIIRGAVPSGSWVQYCWIDGQVLEPPNGLARAIPDGSGSAMHYLEETLKDFESAGGEWVRGTVRFLVLVSDQPNEFPILKKDISIFEAANGNHAERRRLSNFVDQVRAWAEHPKRQAMMLTWENHE